jgi:signal transduction histidine kinase
MKRFLRLRWILFSMAILAIVGLTAMNIYSLYALHETNVSATIDNQKNQLADFGYTVRNRFRVPVEGIWRLNMEQLDEEFSSKQPLNNALAEILKTATFDPIYGGIYFIYPDFVECGTDNGSVYTFSSNEMDLIETDSFPEEVCDGFSLARTRMRVLINDYRWNTKVVFDTHRSMTVALINPRGHDVVGYFNFTIKQDYLVKEFIKRELIETFGPPQQSGMTIWLHDWLKNEVLASNDDSSEYDRRTVQFIQRFPDLLDNWNLKVSFDENSTITASKSSLTRNLIVLGGGVFFLVASILILVLIAQKERQLADRQAGFLANVTHELKTPLAVMQAAGENLADGRVNDPSRLKSYGSHIHTEAVRLRKMIEKLLDVAKNDAGQLVVKPSAYTASMLLAEFMDENSGMFANSGFVPEVSIEEGLPDLFVDRDSFSTILSNLVENAIKYSGDSKHLGIHFKKSGNFVQMDVQDKGLGIPSTSIKLIFEKFYRVEDSLTASTKGHGLGLSIVKSLVELNGGKIFVNTSYRKGSIFSVQFPLWSTTPKTDIVIKTLESKVEYAS